MTTTPTTFSARKSGLDTDFRAENRHRTERGAAIVELPFAVVAICILSLGFLALGQLFLDQQHLTAASRAAARYATKAEPDPTVSPASSARRPSSAQVQTFAANAASPLPAGSVTVTLSPGDNALGRPGDQVTVTVGHAETGGAYGLIASVVNGLGSLIGMKPSPAPTLHASTTAVYE